MKLAVLRHSSYPISSFYRLSTTVTQTIIHITLALPRSCCGLHRNNNSRTWRIAAACTLATYAAHHASRPCEPPIAARRHRAPLFERALVRVQKRRRCTQKQLRVRLLRVVENLIGGAALNNHALIHNNDAVGNVAHR